MVFMINVMCSLFCKAFMHEYILAYTQGRDAGQKYLHMLISSCHVFNNPHIPSDHIAAWRRE
jgi:hypothetical protein